jgi:hypothetical protein
LVIGFFKKKNAYKIFGKKKKQNLFHIKTLYLLLLTLADSGFFLDLKYQSGVKSTVSRVFEDLKFKISEGYKQSSLTEIANRAETGKLQFWS